MRQYIMIILFSGYKYDPQTKTWTSITNMIINRSNFGCVTFDGLIYVLGGFDGIYIFIIYIILCKYNINIGIWY